MEIANILKGLMLKQNIWDLSYNSFISAEPNFHKKPPSQVLTFKDPLW